MGAYRFGSEWSLVTIQTFTVQTVWLEDLRGCEAKNSAEVLCTEMPHVWSASMCFALLFARVCTMMNARLT